MPQPVGIAQYEGVLIVVCEDGAVYRCDQGFQAAPEDTEWVMLPPVPNTEIQDRMQRLAKQEGGGLQWIGSAPPGAGVNPAEPAWSPGRGGTHSAPFRARSIIPRRKNGES